MYYGWMRIRPVFLDFFLVVRKRALRKKLLEPCDAEGRTRSTDGSRETGAGKPRSDGSAIESFLSLYVDFCFV